MSIMKKRLYALIIMDGFGWGTDPSVSAIDKSGIPHIKKLLEHYPHTTLSASGMSVGLPEGQMGNSEVGHLNIGAGRVVYQELTRITKSISDGDFFQNSALVQAMDQARDKGKNLHLFGLVSDGGVHSHNEHLYALIRMAKERGLKQVYVHAFLDGRDVPPESGAGYLEELESKFKEYGFGKLASVMGRYYAMDRDNRWERVQKAYDCMVRGTGTPAVSGVQAVKDSYAAGVTDEFVVPVTLTEGEKPVALIGEGDSVICFNFRPDRAREITRALTQPNFTGFPAEPLNLRYVCMTQYDATFTGVSIAFAPESLKNTLGEVLAKQGLKQLRIAETEKYAHVTFFFNGGVEKPNEGEDRILVPSPKVATYDLQPEMSAPEVTEKAIEAVRSGKYDVMILNFANCDMVGHTGVMEAAIKAVDTVDECLDRLVKVILEEGGMALITADHGNADRMADESGEPFTAHTTNPVPCILVDDTRKDVRLHPGVLADLAPTLLELMGLKQPAEMTGKSLISK